MKRIILLVLTALWLLMPDIAFAQSTTKLCFPTNLTAGSKLNCQQVDSTNPLPVNASVSLTATALNVTVTNTSSVPVIVSTPNGFGGATGTLTVQNLGAGSLLNVLDTNSAAILSGVTASIPAGTNYIGSTGSSIQTPITLSTSVTTNYVSGNCIGGFQAITVANYNGQSGFITQFMLNGLQALTASSTVYLFNANPSSSTCTDKGTFLLSATDLQKLIAPPTSMTLAVPTGMTQSNSVVSYVPPIPYVTGGSVRTIWFGLVSGSSFTPTSITAFQAAISAALN
jgi:hypothetical protein